MKYRQLGSLRVSEIGFGAWGIGGATEGSTSYGPTNDEVSRAAIRIALTNGINFFDTSNVYGDGHSEEIIGEEVKKWGRQSVVIATKGGQPKHHGQHNLSPQFLRGSLKESLDRLQTDYIDLYQLHSPPLTLITPETVTALENFKKEGLIKEFGLSTKSPLEGPTAIQMGFKILQVNFNLFDQRAWDCGLLDLASQKNAYLIARTPFCFGFLTGKIDGLDFDPKDHRSVWSRAQLEKWLEGAMIFKKVNERFNKENNQNRKLSELALKFCLYPQSVSVVIPGSMTPQEATENASASVCPDLSKKEIATVRSVYKSEGQFFVKQSVGS